jgi:hypothetical protein
MASPAWNRDYDSARRRAEAANKPLAVIIASGSDGWTSICKEGELKPDVRRLLTQHYVCLYVDATAPAERELARSFETKSAPLLVLSDHSRAYQAYRHSGVLTNSSLAQLLQRYSSAQAFAAQQEQAVVQPVAYEPVPCRS